MGLIFFEALYLRIGSYLLAMDSDLHFLDALAYSGYQFVPLLIDIFMKIPGNLIKYSYFIYSTVSFTIFMVLVLFDFCSNFAV